MTTLTRDFATGVLAPAVPRPIRLMAHATALTLVPSGLWRLAVAFGVPSGFAEGDPLHHSNFPGPLSFYLVGLSIVAELVGLLTLGLVQSWGEVLPRWLPFVGGRRVPVLAAVVPASIGAAIVTLAAVLGALGWNAPDNMGHPDAPAGAAYWVMTASYAPLLLWGPLLAVVTIAYYRRRKARPTGDRMPAEAPVRHRGQARYLMPARRLDRTWLSGCVSELLIVFVGTRHVIPDLTARRITVKHCG